MMPDVSLAVLHFEETLKFQLVTKTVTATGDLAETPTIAPQIPLWFEGTLEPLPPSALMVKPEGERHFQWWTLFTDFTLRRDQIVIDEQQRTFRVMNKTNWSQAGYNAYELIEGPGL